MGLDYYKDKWDKKKAYKDILQRELKIDLEEKEKAEETALSSEKALIVVQDVAKITQQKLEFRISKLVSTALSAVFPDPPEFKASFVIRRNQTECDLLFVENNEEQKPTESSGGGTIDVASFALRIARWSLNKNRRTLILDEPFRNVSPDLQHKVSDMVSMLSEKLGLQIIMVSHADDINVSANKTFTIVKEKEISKIQ